MTDTSVKKGYCVELCQSEGVCFLECDTFNAGELCWKRVGLPFYAMAFDLLIL